MSSPTGSSMMGTMGTTWPAQGQRPSTPTTIHQETEAPGDGMTVRPMRLKVLYTLDAATATNCLARWPHTLSVRTIAIDPNTVIGLVDLQTCIQAVMECSPDLMPRADMDYTIYAYDYSEYDSPLVGQGMLSKALAAASPAPGAPISQAQSLVTGRVCKNIQAMISNGAGGPKESLEVRLRLVPVPKQVQNDYLQAMQRYRTADASVAQGPEFAEWARLLQQQVTNTTQAAPLASNAQIWPHENRNFEGIHQLLSPRPSSAPQGPGAMLDTTSAAGSPRDTTFPADAHTSNGTIVKRPHSERPSMEPSTMGSHATAYEDGVDADDGPMPRKRAKIMQTNWKSRQSLDSTPDSLRVAASTAGSLRMFRPIATATNPAAPSHLKEVPRAPTPVPTHGRPSRHAKDSQTHPPRPSFFPLSQTGSPPVHHSPYPPLPRSDAPIRESIEAHSLSPEVVRSNVGTPTNIPSSPPVMRHTTSLRSSPPCPSSPELPPLKQMDSGFMSGSFEDIFGDDDFPLPLDDDLASLSEAHCVSLVPAARDSALCLDFLGRFDPAQDICSEAQLPTLPAANKNTAPSAASPCTDSSPHKVVPSTLAQLPMNRSLDTRAPSLANDTAQPAASGQKAPVSKRQADGARSSDKHRSSTSALASASSRPSQGTPPTEIARKANSPSPAVSASFPPRVEISSDFQVMTQPDMCKQVKDGRSAFSKKCTRPQQRSMIRTASVGSISLPSLIASDPVVPQPTLKRAMTTTYTEMAAKAMEFTPEDSTEQPYSRTSKAKREANERRLQEALMKGEMPPYCQNCGAIETPTWRKAWTQKIQGPPAYYEYSDQPGRVTMVVILDRSSDGQPTSHMIVKKFLLPTDDDKDYDEYCLCNPCGIWMSKYKCNRPKDIWDKPQPRGAPNKKKQTQRAAKPARTSRTTKSDRSRAASEADFPQSEPAPVKSAPASVVSHIQAEPPTESTHIAAAASSSRHTRQSSEVPIKRRNPMTSGAASAALRRAIQSSPARWGSRRSPIELDDDEPSAIDPTRRLLFPSPRKDGSPKVLGETMANTVIPASTKALKAAVIDIPNKENCQPTTELVDAVDAELVKLFEEELAEPTTPKQRSTAPNPFKTPTQPASQHRPITRSITKSGKASIQRPLSPHRTPTKTPRPIGVRRSPRHQTMGESPMTASLNMMLSEASYDSPSRRSNNMPLDFGDLPDLSTFDTTSHLDLHFPLPPYDAEDLFSTDVPMPSSPPKPFQLYEDPDASRFHVDWHQFASFDVQMANDTAVDSRPAKDETRKGDDDGSQGDV